MQNTNETTPAGEGPVPGSAGADEQETAASEAAAQDSEARDADTPDATPGDADQGEAPSAPRVNAVGLIAAAGLGAQGSELSQALGSAHAVRVFRRLELAGNALEVLAPDTLIVGYAEGVTGAHRLIGVARGLRIPVVIALIDAPELTSVDRALRAGAHDVVPYPHSAADILVRRQVQLQTRATGPDPIEMAGRHVSLGPLTIDLTMRQVVDGGQPLNLTGREFELLVRLMKHQGDIVTREQLIEDIWGPGGTDAVLDATVHRLRRKLKRKVGDEELVTTVRGRGYRIKAGTFRTPTG